MDLLLTAIATTVKDNLPDIYVYIDDYEPAKFPGLILGDCRMTPLTINSEKKAGVGSQRYRTKFIFNATLIHQFNRNDRDTIDYQIRHEMYQQVLRLLLEKPAFLNNRVITVDYLGTERFVQEKGGTTKVFHDIEIGYNLMQNWAAGLDSGEIFSKSEKLNVDSENM